MKLTHDWIVGFVDGDGHFGIEKTQSGTDRCFFVLSQDKRSVDVLYAVKAFFKCGSVHKAGQNMMQYKVTSKKHLIDTILPFFEQNPLRTTKRQKFIDIAGVCLTSRNVNIQHNKPLSAEWLLGFLDAEASFVCSKQGKSFVPQMILGLHPNDKEILDQIHQWMGYGVRYAHKNKTEIFQLSSQNDLHQFIISFLLTKGSKDRLRTKKRIQVRKWCKLVLLLHTKQHLTSDGFTKACHKYELFKKAKVEDRVRSYSKD